MRINALAVAQAVGVVLSALTACQSPPSHDRAAPEDPMAAYMQVAAYSGEAYAVDYALQEGLVSCGYEPSGGWSNAAVDQGECASYGPKARRATEVLGHNRATAGQALAGAIDELEEARATDMAAAMAVHDLTMELQNLRIQVANRGASPAEYEDAVGAAKGFQAYLGGAIERITDSIDDIDRRIALTARSDPSEASELEETRQELDMVRAALFRKLDLLMAAIASHESRLSL